VTAPRCRDPRRLARPALIALLLTLVALPVGAAVTMRRVTLDIRDTGGTRLDSRVSLRSDQFGQWYPTQADTAVLAHAGYSYPRSGASIEVPEGWVTLVVSRGPEWVPYSRQLWIGRDTTVSIRLSRFLDMRGRNFYSSDLHVHSRHDPVEFDVPPAAAKRIAKAEDLAILHLLDNEYRFQGAPDSISDSQTTLYYSWEYRHQTYGHVSLPGLRTSVPWGCCLAPSEAWPMLDEMARQVAGPGKALFVLAHPGSSDHYLDVHDWPGTGIGREYALLAARGRLNGFDVASYSNQPHARWQDWYDALSSGIALTPTAGTDAVLNFYNHLPAGGWRVYADMGSSVTYNYDNWIETVRQGRTFVTSLPLIPRFRVSTKRPGQTLEAAGDTTSFALEIEAACVTGLTQLSVVSSAGTEWTLDLSKRATLRTKFDTTLTLRRATPAWLALKVEGVTGHRMSLGLPAIAHTSAIRILKNGVARTEPGACGRMLDRVDDLEKVLNVRRNWSVPWHEDTVRAGIAAARTFYGRVFKKAPGKFHLSPPPPSGATRFEWTPAPDEEPGDRVRYRVTVAADSLFQDGPVTFFSDEPWIGSTPARPSLPSWWRVEAVDRGGNTSPLEPATFHATLLVNSLDAPVSEPQLRPRVFPNPARGPVRLEGLGSDVAVYDVTGRRVASAGRGLRAEGPAWVWDLRDRGERARPGLYWAVSRRRGVSVRLTVLE
jgi:hypothetical protein